MHRPGYWPPIAPALLPLCLALCSTAFAADLLRVEAFVAPARVPAGSSVPIEVRMSVVEPVRDGWRVSFELAPVAGGHSYAEGPSRSPFGSGTGIGEERVITGTVPLPADALPGRYHIIVDHYDQVDGEWVHARYVGRDGQPAGPVVGDLEVTAPVGPLPAPLPQRRLRPGEIHRVFECEDFSGMDGRGDDAALVRGWTWSSDIYYSRGRAAVNTVGSGTIHKKLDAPLPPGSYKIFLRAGSAFSPLRVRLGDATVEGAALHVGWNELGTVTTQEPARRIELGALQRVGADIIVDSVYVTNDLTATAMTGWDPSRQFLPVDARPVKREPTIYTAKYLAQVAEKTARHPDLRKRVDDAIAAARAIAEHPDETLWGLLADTSIRRTHYVNQNKGCPVCGLKIKEFDVFHPWILDPIGHPFKMQCPSCKRYFPTNDFAAGEMTGGEYPDDGSGCVVGDDTYHFLGEYIHFAYLRFFVPYLQSLTSGVVYSQDPALAHKLAVMLLRAAQQYPNSEDRADRAFHQKWQPDGGTITDPVWSSYDGRDYGLAYDAVWPFLDGDDALLELARREIPGIRNHEDIRLYIEENLLRRIGQAYCDSVIMGNAGYHHKGMAWLMLALDDPDSERFPNSMDLLEFAYYRVYGALRYFGNLLGMDGGSFESTSYNASRLNMVEVISTMDRFFERYRDRIDPARYPLMWDDPRFAAMFDYFTDYVMLDRWYPTVGDVGGDTIIPKRTEPGLLSVVSPDLAAQAWGRYRTPKLALLAYGASNTPPAESLGEGPPLGELAASRAAAPEKLEQQTNILDDYGVAILRSGRGEDARAACIWYGSLLSHAHDDKLQIGLLGRGLDLLPDLGYPKSWEHAGRWEAHSLTHNTLTVDDESFPSGRVKGRLTLLGSLPGLQIVEAQERSPTHRHEVARRLLALVDVSSTDFYLVDLFDARAGSSHTLSYHGPQAETTVEGVTLTDQPTGTVAGPEVEYGQRETPLSHMTQVQRGSPTGPFRVSYDLGAELCTHIRLHLFPDHGAELALGTGRPPSQPDAYAVRYCLQSRSGAAPLEGRYLTVVEPYGETPVLGRVERLSSGRFGQGEALRIGHAGGEDLLLVGPDGRTTVAAAGCELVGRAGLVRLRDGAPVLLTAYGFSSLRAPGVRLQTDRPFVTGRIVACDYRGRAITVSGVPPDERLIGAPVRIHNALRSSMHTITGIARQGRRTVLTLATTPLRHEGRLSAVRDGTVGNGAPNPWAFDTYYQGTRLVSEDSGTQWTVTGASGGWWSAPTNTMFHLARTDGGPAGADALAVGLRDANGDGIVGFWVYEYGVGDRVEIASFAKVEINDAGAWSGIVSPGVEIACEDATR